MNNWSILILYFGLSTLATAAFVQWLRYWLTQQQVVALPNHRSLHTLPTPSGAGIGIVLTLLIGLSTTLYLFENTFNLPIVVYLFCGSLLALVGFIDDMRSLPARLRFSVQFAVALAAVFFIGDWQEVILPFTGSIRLGWVGIPLTFVWVVGMINAYNFMDGIDGIAASHAIVASIGWFGLAIYANVPIVMIWTVLIAGSSLGFLYHNWHPAKVFMGDAGSTLLGFTFATIPLYFVHSSNLRGVTLVASILLIWPFLFDTVFTFVHRLIKRENVLEAHRTHLYQRLVTDGMMHNTVTILYILLAASSIPLLGLWLTQSRSSVALFSTLWMSIVAIFVSFVKWRVANWNRFVAPFLVGLSNQIKSWRNRYYFVLDVFLLMVTPLIALFLRIDTEPPALYVNNLLIYTLSALVFRITIFYTFGLYRRVWQYADKNDLVQIMAAVAVSSIGITITFFVVRQITPVILPRSIPIIDSVLTLLAIGGNRFASHILSWQHPIQVQPLRRVLIVGVGDTGASIAREIRNTPKLATEVVGFMDNDLEMVGQHIYSVPIIGHWNTVDQAIAQLKIQQVIIAMPNAPGKLVREIVQICEKANVQTKIVPTISEVLSGTVKISQLRDVQIEDLLRREPVDTDFEAVRSLIRGKTVIITGGGGSIGGELCRQIWACDPKKLVILGHGENSVFSINAELRALRPLPGELHAVIADIRFPDRIHAVFEEFQPDIVFHAAAHKHVPLMEHNPVEAITNNVFGTRNVLAAAQRVGVERFVMISTDKAVNPTSVMGVTKRMAEMLVHRTAQETQRPYVVVRFGNVLGSRGSVVLTFRKQIEAGGPVTVTDERMTRFFMTIPEAVQLVLQSAVLGSGDEVFVLDMGEPVKIVDLATDLIELSGFEVGKDIDIVFTGMRPGEKLYEELFSDGEQHQRTRHHKIFLANNAGEQHCIKLDELLSELKQLVASNQSSAEVIEALRQLIPSYQPPNVAQEVVEQTK